MPLQPELEFTKAEITGQLSKSRINILYGLAIMGIGMGLLRMGQPYGWAVFYTGVTLAMSTILDEAWAYTTLVTLPKDSIIRGREFARLMKSSANLSRLSILIGGVITACAAPSMAVAFYTAVGYSFALVAPHYIAGKSERALVRSKATPSPQ